MTDEIKTPGSKSEAPAAGAQVPPPPTAAELAKQRLARATAPEFVRREKELRGRIDTCAHELSEAEKQFTEHQARLRTTSGSYVQDERKAIIQEVRGLENFPEDISAALEQRALRYLMLKEFANEHRGPVRLDQQAAQEVIHERRDSLRKAQEDLADHLKQLDAAVPAKAQTGTVAKTQDSTKTAATQEKASVENQ
jgi:hypothetical protein